MLKVVSRRPRRRRWCAGRLRLNGPHVGEKARFTRTVKTRANLQICVGGESGIRTHGRVSPTHAFQACSFNHSDISPSRINDLRAVWNSVARNPPSNRLVPRCFLYAAVRERSRRRSAAGQVGGPAQSRPSERKFRDNGRLANPGFSKVAEHQGDCRRRMDVCVQCPPVKNSAGGGGTKFWLV